MANADIGLIGLGTMGAMLTLNIADNGFSVAVFNRTKARTTEFIDSAGTLADKLTACDDLESLVAAIEKPRNIILMVPAGEPVDQQIAQLRPLLDTDDMIIDAGNANFLESERLSWYRRFRRCRGRAVWSFDHGRWHTGKLGSRSAYSGGHFREIRRYTLLHLDG